MKYLLTALVVFAAAISHAQSSSAPQWNYGVKADVNFTHIQGDGMPSGYTSGFQGGIFVERTFNSKWSVQPELLLTQNNTKKGKDFFNFYNTSGNTFAAEDVKLAYISVPVMFKYNINHNFSLLAGPQYSFLIKDAESLLRSGDGKAFKKGEFSGNVGGQFNVGRVAIYGRYNAGFSNINNIDDRYKWHSSHIQAGIAVRIN